VVLHIRATFMAPITATIASRISAAKVQSRIRVATEPA